MVKTPLAILRLLVKPCKPSMKVTPVISRKSAKEIVGACSQSSSPPILSFPLLSSNDDDDDEEEYEVPVAIGNPIFLGVPFLELEGVKADETIGFGDLMVDDLLGEFDFRGREADPKTPSMALFLLLLPPVTSSVRGRFPPPEEAVEPNESLLATSSAALERGVVVAEPSLMGEGLGAKMFRLAF